MSIGADEHCPVCGAGEGRPIPYRPDDFEYGVDIASWFRLQGCDACGSEYVLPRPTLDELAAMYPREYYAYGGEMGWLWRTLYERRCRQEAKRLLALMPRRPVRLFDVGAGDCRHFQAIAPLGAFQFAGVEMNAAMASAARRAGFDVAEGAFEEYNAGPRAGTADILTMNHLIEHVLDPGAMLDKARTILADGGVLYGRTPKLGSIGLRVFKRYWGGYHFPRHLHLFSASSLAALIQRHGFHDVEIREDLNLFPALSLQNFLVGHLKLGLALNGGHTRLWPLLVATTTPLSVLDFLLGRGDCMIFVARR